MRVDAILLAGGDGAVIDPHCRFKGLVPISGRPMIEWVVDAMREAEMVESIAVVVPSAEELGHWVDKVDKLVVSSRSFMGNVIAGVESFRVDRPALVATGDLPTLTGLDVDDFLRTSLATGADFTYPLIPKERMLEQFPGCERTFVRLATGHVTGGNMMLVNPALVSKNSVLGQRMFDARKSPLHMARIVGPRFVWRLITGRLDPDEVAAKIEEIVGGSAAAIVSDCGSIGMDVDKQADVLLVERLLAERG